MLLPEQPTGSVLLHAGAPDAPLGSAQSRHGVRRPVGPQRQLDPQDCGQCCFNFSFLSHQFSQNVPLQYALQSRRGHCSVLLETLKGFIQITFAVGLRVDAELIPLFPPHCSRLMSSCWPSSTT